MEQLRQFMVTFRLPEELTYEFMNKVPEQRKMINDMLSQGHILSYSLSLNRKFLWIIFLADTKRALMRFIHKLPLNEFLQPEVEELAFHNASYPLPAVSLN